jgi:hypothetical protein
MKIKEKLKRIVCYYNMTRQCGHTSLMFNGVYATPEALVLVPNITTGKALKSKTKKIQVDYANVNSDAFLRGCRKPIAFDNSTLQVLFNDAIKEIDRLEKENQLLKSK